MKLVRSTGKEILIYELPEPIWRLAMGRGPIQAHGFFLLTDDAALDLVHDLVVVQRGPAAWTE
jgi:hypothetical protein